MSITSKLRRLLYDWFPIREGAVFELWTATCTASDGRTFYVVFPYCRSSALTIDSQEWFMREAKRDGYFKAENGEFFCINGLVSVNWTLMETISCYIPYEYMNIQVLYSKDEILKLKAAVSQESF